MIELLAVGAILGVLAVLLVPRIKGVLGIARSVQCLNNSRQWSVAAWMFGDEHEEIFPYEGHFLTRLDQGSNREAWYNVVPSYAGVAALSDLYRSGAPPVPGRRSLFVCPEVRSSKEITPTMEKPLFMYGMNNRLDPNGPSRFRRDQLSKPAATVVFTETRWQRFPSSSGRYSASRHRDRANLAFADGHAEAVHSNDFFRTRDEDRESSLEWKLPRKVYWYPFPGAPR